MSGSTGRLWPLGLIFLLTLAPGVAVSQPKAPSTSEANNLKAVPSSWPIRVTMQPVLLDSEQPKRRELGALTLLSGFALTSTHEAFGGFSGLTCLSDDRLLAVSDRGHWWVTDLDLDEDGRLRRLHGSRMGPLLDDDGQPVQGRARRDAEDITPAPSGGFLVSFEGTHRIEVYGAEANAEAEGLEGLPQPFPSPRSVQEAHFNKGLESMTRLADGRLLLLTEGLLQGDGTLRGWIGSSESAAKPGEPTVRHETWSFETWSLEPLGPFQPTAATTLPEGGPWAGDVVILKRHYTPETGTRVRVLRLTADDLRPGAKLQGETLASFEGSLTVDNFEGLTACAQGTDRTVLYLISDDNFNESQRTLLLQFALTPSSSRPE